MSAIRSAQEQECILLNLPGEIRNQIYYFSGEPQSIALYPPRSAKPIKIHYHEEDDDAAPIHLPHQRVFQTLTQVCRQIRTEFLPIYQTANTVHIRHFELDAYLAHLQPVRKPIAATIAFDMCRQRAGAKKPPCEAGRPTDLLPALKLLHESPHLTISPGHNTCRCSKCGPDLSRAAVGPSLTVLFNIRKNNELARYLLAAVERLEVSYPPRLTWVMKKIYWQEYMETVERIGFGWMQWFEKTGLGKAMDGVGANVRFVVAGEEREEEVEE